MRGRWQTSFGLSICVGWLLVSAAGVVSADPASKSHHLPWLNLLLGDNCEGSECLYGRYEGKIWIGKRKVGNWKLTVAEDGSVSGKGAMQTFGRFRIVSGRVRETGNLKFRTDVGRSNDYDFTKGIFKGQIGLDGEVKGKWKRSWRFEYCCGSWVTERGRFTGRKKD